MRVLVATNELQGTRPGDYAWTVEGEIVVADPTVCRHPSCGCGRGFSGIASDRATTTAMVADLPHVSVTDLRDVLSDWLERCGWADLLPEIGEIDEIVDEHLDNLEAICAAFPVGSVVERSGTEIRPRWLAAAA
jgi:hypothetical protein